ncbi:MAG: M20/M25/M40 family metallo-hydrolase [Planctomycetota bacterium]
MKFNPINPIAQLFAAACFLASTGISSNVVHAQVAVPQESKIESSFLSGIRQITFEGRRAGEGYFSKDGSLMVFQSERRADNPFYQMYLLDFETGDVESVSPGHGKTTCGWVHPDNSKVLFASTQDDPEARNKQRTEIEFRESGQQRRYAWDYDETYELYAWHRGTETYDRLTNAKGYDAEASYSPDGKLIAFASNRNGYSKDLNERQKKMFEIDPAYMMDIFIMNADGSNVRQLTDVPGYDGGPFFSPDGKKICWRRFSEDGLKAEIMTMNIDGSEQKQLTNLNAMSWAPYFHPSGKYLIFTTNRHGFGNFELYLVDAAGKSKPVRVTDTDGFDGLASFTPDGKRMTWTSNRTSNSNSQIYISTWNHEAALKALNESESMTADETESFKTGTEAAKQANASFEAVDIVRHVDYLCRPELAGRMTGSKGERKATAYVAAYFDYLGLKPMGDDQSWFQTFEFPDGAEIGSINKLTLTGSNVDRQNFNVNEDWRPLSFSGNTKIDPSEIVYAGYGIVAPKTDEIDEYDSYVHLDVKDKWVLVFRFFPEDVGPKARRHFQNFAKLRKKVFYARERGAKGLIVVSGPNSQVREQLVPMTNDFSPSGSSIASISISDEVANKIFTAAGKKMQELQNKLDDGSPQMGFDLKDVLLGGAVDIKKVTGIGRNVVGRLMAGDKPSKDAIIVGAHIDHLGLGKTGGSLAKSDERNNIHFGADDNASGVAAMLEIAEYLANQKKQGKLKLKRDVIFAGWSGEELGLHGSKHFASKIRGVVAEPAADADDPARDKSHDFNLAVDANNRLSLNGESTTLEEVAKSLKFIGEHYPDFEVTVVSDLDAEYKAVAKLLSVANAAGVTKISVKARAGSGTRIVAALNMDMVGRLKDKLVLQGVSSSSVWPRLIESKNAVVGLPVTTSDETDLPTDASSFYRAGVPILSAFTGSHNDYHTPRDTPEKLNYPDAARVARLMGLITRTLATAEETPDFIKQKPKEQQAIRGGIRAYLGTVPSYGEDVVGVLLSETTLGGPAANAGVKGGDVIVELGESKIENIYDYTAILDTLKIGEETSIVVQRDGKRVKMKITPGSRK